MSDYYALFIVTGPQVPVPPQSSKAGVDLRYAATYGNPYLRNSSLGKPLLKRNTILS